MSDYYRAPSQSACDVSILRRQLAEAQERIGKLEQERAALQIGLAWNSGYLWRQEDAERARAYLGLTETDSLADALLAIEREAIDVALARLPKEVG